MYKRQEQALDRAEEKEAFVQQLLQNRAVLQQKLQQHPLVQHVFPSDSNQLLVRFTDAAGVFRHLTRRQIIVRDRSAIPLCEGCLRITVGSQAEDEALLEALDAFRK